MTNEQAKVGMELDSEMLQLMNEANKMSRTADELSWVTDFVREGIQHGTIAEAVWQALREVREGASISLTLQIARSEWYK